MTDDDRRAMRATGSVCTGRLNRPAIKLPYFTLDGGDSGFYRWRCLDDLKPKYLQERGTGVHIYLPPGTDWVAIAADPKIAIGVTEGEFKSYIVTQRVGMPTIGLGGVNSYGSKRAGELILKELLLFNWAGREILMMFDSDAATNSSVAWALSDCALKLSGLGARPRMLNIPPAEDGSKLGADDFIQKHGHIAFQQLPKTSFAHVEQLYRINSEYALIRNPVGIYSFATGQIIPQNDFLLIENKYSAIVPTAKGDKAVKAGTQWLVWPGRREYPALTYQPGEPLVTKRGELNTFPGWGSESLPGLDVLFFLWLLDRLIPNRRMRRWMIQWLAHMIQRPCEKVMSALVLFGPQGTGKSLLTEMLMAVVGASNCATIGNKELGSDFTGWAANKLLIIAEEVSGLDPKHDGARLKGFITLPEVTINEKYVRAYSLPNLARFIFCSNTRVPVFLDPDDRRYAICKTLVANKIPSTIGTAIKKWTIEEGGAGNVRYYLEHVNLAGFDPAHRPPLSEDKLEVIENSRTSLQSWAKELMSDEDRPALALGKELAFVVKEELDSTPTLRALYNALKDAGAIQLPRVRVNSRRKQGLWSLRGPVKDPSETALRTTLDAELKARNEFFGLVNGKVG